MATQRRSFAAAAAITAALLVGGSGVALAQSTGGDQADDISGTNTADTLNGYAGNDTIRGGSSADRINGGDDNDMLFGTDEFQSGLKDGTQTSVDGNDRIDGGNGDDWVVGASASDTLRGGPGADTITEGPVNDSVADTIEADPTIFSGGPPPEAETWNDNISVASMPASKDYVNCGPGTDSVQADPLDVLNANCENVEIVDPKPSAPITVQGETGPEAAPAVASTEGDSIAEVLNGGDTPEDPSETPPEPEGTINEQFGDHFRCWAPRAFAGDNWCATTRWVGLFDRAFIHHRDANPTKWVRFNIIQSDKGWIRSRTLHENWGGDATIWYGFGYAHFLHIRARTSCWSNCAFGTQVELAHWEIVRY